MMVSVDFLSSSGFVFYSDSAYVFFEYDTFVRHWVWSISDPKKEILNMGMICLHSKLLCMHAVYEKYKIISHPLDVLSFCSVIYNEILLKWDSEVAWDDKY